MFSNEVLEKIFENPKLAKVPLVYQSVVVRAIEEVLEDMENEEVKTDATVSES